MNIIIAVVLISILLTPNLVNLMFLAVGKNIDEAIILHERGLASFLFTKVKFIMYKMFNKRYLEIR